MGLGTARTEARAATLVATRSAALPRLGAAAIDRLALAWYGLLTLISVWPLLRAPERTVVAVPLDPVFQATVLQRIADHLVRLDFAHLWEGGFFYPATNTLAMSDSLVALQPVALPLLLLLREPILVANILLVATFPLAAISADLLARLLTRSRVAGWVAGTIFAFAAFRFAHIGHLNLLQSWTLPLVFLALELVLRSGSRRAAIAWGALHVVVAGTAWNYLLILALTEPIYLLARLALAEDRRAALRRVGLLVLPGLLAALAIAVLAQPYFALREEGFARSEIDTFDFSARATDYLVPAEHGVLTGPLSSFWRPFTGQYERSLSPGWAALALAAVGAAVALRRAHGRRRWLRTFGPWLAVGAAAFTFSFGPRLWPEARWLPGKVEDYLVMPFGWLDSFLPLESIRSPARFGVLVLLAVALLAGAWTARWWRARALAAQGRLPLRLVAGLALVFILEYSVLLPTAPTFSLSRPPLVYEWLRDQPAGPVIELPTNEPDRALHGATVDGHPRLNGWSGFVPPVSAEVNAGLLWAGVVPEEDPAWLREVQDLGARYLVVHEADVSPRTNDVLRAHQLAGRIRPVARFGSEQVYLIEPGPTRLAEDPARGP